MKIALRFARLHLHCGVSTFPVCTPPENELFFHCALRRNSVTHFRRIMTDKELVNLIRERIPGLTLREGEPMSRHCSFRIGGPADIFAEPDSEERLLSLCTILQDENVPWTVIGRGTNLLVCDEGISGAVIKLGDGFASARAEGTEITASAGISLSRLALLAQRGGLTGLEFAHGIPGSLGGAVMMNAGAYGGEIKDVTVSVRALDPDGAIRTYSGNELDFSYRRSRFAECGGVILSAVLRLTRGDGEEIERRMRELAEKRSGSQPLDKPSAGSTFKRPATGYAAAMIDGAGLKGFKIGGAEVSEKHAGFVVNTGGASFADVTAVMEHVQKMVLDKYGVHLEPEVRIIRH